MPEHDPFAGYAWKDNPWAVDPFTIEGEEFEAWRDKMLLISRVRERYEVEQAGYARTRAGLANPHPDNRWEASGALREEAERVTDGWGGLRRRREPPNKVNLGPRVHGGPTAFMGSAGMGDEGVPGAHCTIDPDCIEGGENELGFSAYSPDPDVKRALRELQACGRPHHRD